MGVVEAAEGSLWCYIRYSVWGVGVLAALEAVRATDCRDLICSCGSPVGPLWGRLRLDVAFILQAEHQRLRERSGPAWGLAFA